MTGRRLACIAVLAAVLVFGTPAGAGAATSTLLDPGAERVLVVSTPMVGWSLINDADTPNLWRLRRDTPRWAVCRINCSQRSCRRLRRYKSRCAERFPHFPRASL